MVEAAGGTVTGDEWREMGIKSGYDPRALGGFYRGPNPTMRMNPDDTGR